jgi:hypothetical protein
MERHPLDNFQVALFQITSFSPHIRIAGSDSIDESEAESLGRIILAEYYPSPSVCVMNQRQKLSVPTL